MCKDQRINRSAPQEVLKKWKWVEWWIWKLSKKLTTMGLQEMLEFKDVQELVEQIIMKLIKNTYVRKSEGANLFRRKPLDIDSFFLQETLDCIQ